MKTKLLKDISSSTAQVVLNQALGLLTFVIISRYLDKVTYGEMNWSLALLTFITTLLSLRLEQIVVRKVAAGHDPSKMLTLFSWHILFSGVFFYAFLLIGSFIFPSFFKQHNLLLILGISHLLSFFASPYKQLVTGKEKFGWLAMMSSVSNLIRSVCLVSIVLFSFLTISQVLFIYILSSLAELSICIFFVQKRLRIGISFRYTMRDYRVLILESLPQIGMVFLNACIARIDWILLGFFSTQVITAEYSFAYKVFELSPIPLLIIAPVLLTRFSGYFTRNRKSSLLAKQPELDFLIRFEMILATFLPMVLNVVWVPLIDQLTQNKYGSVNKITILLLSLSIPFQYLINLFWTIHFSLNHLALIFRITAITGLIMIVGNLFMIPLMNAHGSALVYLTTMVTEYLLYIRYSSFSGARKSIAPLIICTTIAVACGFTVDGMNTPVIVRLFLSSVLYGVLIVMTRQLKKKDVLVISKYLLNPDIKLMNK